MRVTLGRIFPALLLFGERWHGRTSELKHRADSRADDNFRPCKVIVPVARGRDRVSSEISLQPGLRKFVEDNERYKPELKAAIAYAVLSAHLPGPSDTARFR